MEKIFGLIAEFNPLHKGHEFLIKNLRTKGSVIVILSSNFVQRGEPSIIDKFYRAEIAILSGADLVIENPFLFSCSAAQDFSSGAVDLLGKTNFANYISFGMENPEFNFEPIIDVMLNEPEEYKNFLRNELKKGASFSKANSLALENLVKGSGEFISKPNNLLAVSYMLNIRKKNYNLKIFPVKREGIFKSSSIRKNLFEKNNFSMLPEFSKKIIFDSQINGRLCNNYSEKLWLMLKIILIRSSPDDLKKIYGIDEGIENLFFKNFKVSNNLDDFIGRCVSSRYTRSHIRRRILNIILNLKRDFIYELKNSGIKYSRVLAFNENGRRILKNFSKNSEIPIITKLKETKSPLANLEFKASELYELLLDNQNFKREVHSVLKF